jgi:biotin carboxyl carrier protein
MTRQTAAVKREIKMNGALRHVEFAPPGEQSSRVTLTMDGRVIEAEVLRVSESSYSILLGGRPFEVAAEETATGLLLRVNGREFQVQIVDPRSWQRGRGAGVELEGCQQLIAPMSGKLVRVLVAVGDHVDAGQGLLVIEAMKMQNELRSPKSGTVEKLAAEGRTVNAGEILAVVA